MDFSFERPKKRKLLILQLAPMIDVFVLIIVFLLKATVLSGVAITWPSDLKTAKSKSNEGVENASQVVVSKDFVDLKMLNKKIPLLEFGTQIEKNKKQLGAEMSSYVDSLKKKNDVPLMNINLVADAGVQYQQLFPVIAYLRGAGFNSILFVAEGESK